MLFNHSVLIFEAKYSRMDHEEIRPAQADHIPSNFLKAVFHKFFLVYSWILCPIYEP